MCLISLCPKKKNVVLSFDPSLTVDTVCGSSCKTYLLDPRHCQGNAQEYHPEAGDKRKKWFEHGRPAADSGPSPAAVSSRSHSRTVAPPAPKKYAWKRYYCRLIYCIFSLCVQKTWEVREGEKRTLLVMDECVFLNFALLLDVLETWPHNLIRTPGQPNQRERSGRLWKKKRDPDLSICTLQNTCCSDTGSSAETATRQSHVIAGIAYHASRGANMALRPSVGDMQYISTVSATLPTRLSTRLEGPVVLQMKLHCHECRQQAVDFPMCVAKLGKVTQSNCRVGTSYDIVDQAPYGHFW